MNRYLFLSLLDYCIPPLPANGFETSPSDLIPDLSLDITTLKIGGRGHGIDRNLDSFPPFRFHSSSRPSPFFVLQTNRSIRSFVLSLPPPLPPSLSILCLSRVTTDRQNGSNWMQIGNDCNPITGYLISHPFAGGRTLKNTRIG